MVMVIYSLPNYYIIYQIANHHLLKFCTFTFFMLSFLYAFEHIMNAVILNRSDNLFCSVVKQNYPFIYIIASESF